MAATHHGIEWTPRGRVVGALAALALVAAWLGGHDRARLAAALLAAPVAVDFVLKQRHLHRVAIRVARRQTAAGAPYTERLELRNDATRPLRECLLFEPRTMRAEPPVLFVQLAPRGALVANLRQRSSVRSHVLERVFVLASTWPLGMFRSRAAVAVAAELVTEPAPVRLRAELLRAFLDEEAQRHSAARHDGDEFHSLREHLPDEDARRVHALRSATAGTLVRRVLRGSMPRRAGIVVDLRRPPGRRLDQGARRFEWSLGSCVSLVQWLRAHGVEVTAMVVDAEPVRVEVRNAREQRELFTLLAEASPTPHRQLPEDLFAPLAGVDHRYWIPAGSYFAAPEFAAMQGRVTLIGEEDM
jgi:uncharacterized protein (DUF58 family)